MAEQFFIRDRRTTDSATADSPTADSTVVTIGGELDVATAPALRSYLSDLIADGHTRLVLDLARLGFLDASGMGVLASTVGRLHEQGGWLRLVNVRPRIRRLLGIVRLTDALPEYASVALAATPAPALLTRLAIPVPVSPASAETVATATGAVARPMVPRTRTPAKGTTGDE